VNDVNNSVVETKIRKVVFAFVSVDFGEDRVGGGGVLLFYILEKQYFIC